MRHCGLTRPALRSAWAEEMAGEIVARVLTGTSPEGYPEHSEREQGYLFEEGEAEAEGGDVGGEEK